MRRLGIVLTVAFAWALPAAAPAQTALKADEFAAIDRVYAAFGEFGDADGSTAADRVAARAACRGLRGRTPMLARLGRMCSAQLRVGAALGRSARCETRSSCLIGVRRVRRALSELLLLARASNRTVTAAALAPGCTRELRVNMRTLRFYTRLRAGFSLLERALRSGSGTLAQRARRRIDRVQEPDTRSPARQRADFQAACAPPA